VLKVVAVELGTQSAACTSVPTAYSAAFFRGTNMRNESGAGMRWCLKEQDLLLNTTLVQADPVPVFGILSTLTHLRVSH